MTARPGPCGSAAIAGGRVAAALLLTLAAGGCKQSGTTPLSAPPPPRAGPPVALPDGGMAHTEPLAGVTWSGAHARACGGRRVDAGGVSTMTPGACLTRAAPGTPGPAPAPSSFAPGPEAPPPPCRLWYQDIPGDPGAPPARATLVGPRERQLLDAWSVPREVDGDYFAVEAAFSPDGRWLAIVHSAVGLGDGERLVRVEGLEVRPAPACR